MITIHRLRTVTRTLWTDLRYSGSILRSNQLSRFADQGAENVVNSSYEALDTMFADRIKPRDVLVDIGCGKGRVLNYWLSKGLKNQIYGLELDPDIAAAIARRFSRYAQVAVIAGDAVTNVPPDATLLYLFNPFSEDVTRRLKNSLTQRRVTLIYYNPRFAAIFAEDPFMGGPHASDRSARPSPWVCGPHPYPSPKSNFEGSMRLSQQRRFRGAAGLKTAVFPFSRRAWAAV
jgi:hypothetical protein